MSTPETSASTPPPATPPTSPSTAPSTAPSTTPSTTLSTVPAAPSPASAGSLDSRPPTSALRWSRQVTLFCFAALAVLAFGWETWWAPLKPGGSLLALKALPLIAALPFLARGSVKAYQWWSMLVMLYLCEGLVRVVSDASLTGRWLGGIEAALSALAFGAVVVYVRMASRARQMSV